MTISKLAKECISTVNRLAQENVVFLFLSAETWGVRGNVIADHLAQKGSKEHLQGPEPSCGISKQP